MMFVQYSSLSGVSAGRTTAGIVFQPEVAHGRRAPKAGSDVVVAGGGGLDDDDWDAEAVERDARFQVGERRWV